MDIILQLFDEYVLDKAYASLIPLSAFAGPETFNTTSSLLPIVSPTTSSMWLQMVAHLPHPPVRPTDLVSLTTKSISSTTANITYPLPLHHISDISAWPRDYMPRQLLSLAAITLLGIHIFYFLFGAFSYYFIFNHEMMKHPRFLKNQVRLEIQCSLWGFPGMMLLTLPCFLGEVRGWDRLYDGEVKGIAEWAYLVGSVPLFLVFTDYCVYWIHRWLHIPFFYKMLHKPHHKWIIPTPFASHAFHPVDGFLQSVPYHLFVYLFPMHRVLYLVLFVLINFWTVFIHDSDMITGHALEKVINGPAHHTLHHIYFTVNYGQYFTWADRKGGTYRQPDSSLDPMLEVLKLEEEKKGKKEQ